MEGPSHPRDLPAAWQERLGQLRSSLAAGSPVLLAGRSEGFVPALAAAGHPVTMVGNLLDGSLPAGTFGGAVLTDWLDRGRPLRESLAAVHAALADKGRLLIAGFQGDLRELTVALSEAGFVILKEERSEALWQARKDPFSIREYRQGDEEQILPMFHRSFHVERSLPRWSWTYRDDPYGKLKISEAFSHQGKLVAHYAGYPVRFHSEARGEPRAFTALQIGDTMTEPSVRHVGRGPTSLLGRTVRHYYARFCEGQVDFNYGFNTGNIQRFSMSFVGARRLESLPFFVREAGSRPIPALHPVLRRLAGYRVERVTRFDERWDELFRRARGAYRLLVERDARYLDWRYARCPDTEYYIYAVWRRRELAGWSVFRHKGERLLWGDALFDPRHPAAIPLLLSHVLAAPEHRRMRTVEAWITSRPAWWRDRVLALGFASRPEPEDLGFVFVPFRHDPEEDFRAHLYYTMGDSDLF